MSKGISSLITDVDVISPLIMANIQFDTPVYVHSGVGDIVYNSNTYQGLGDLGTISPISETNELQVNDIKLTLSGINNSILTIVMSETYQGQPCTLYLAFRDTVAADLEVFTLFKGLIDNANIIMGENSVIELSVTNELSRWATPTTRRYNNNDHVKRYPSDKAFEFVDQLSKVTLYWGTAEKRDY